VSLESNKVFAAILTAVLLIMIITTLSDSAFHRDESAPAYSIEVVSADAPVAVVEEGPSLAELMAGADAGKGARQFAKCKACHTLDKGGRNGTGPNLYGVMGRSVGAIDEFRYSGALNDTNDVWTWALMDAWLKDPKGTYSGTSMAFAGLRKDGQRADLMAYLRTFADTQLALPEVEAAAEEAVEEAGETADETTGEATDQTTGGQ